MITYPLSFPSGIAPNNFTWSPQSAVVVQPSTFTYEQKVYAWAGQQRFFVAKFPALTLPQTRIMRAFVRKLNGMEGTFYYGDPNADQMGGTVVSGYVGGLVMGANQTGTSIATDGWPISQTIFKAGDYISIGDRLHELLDDATSNGSGQATLSLWPFIRSAYADNAPILVGGAARGIFRLSSIAGEDVDVDLFMQAFTLTAGEDV